MNRRVGWIVGGIVLAALVGGAAVWIAQGSGARPTADSSPTPTVTTSVTNVQLAQSALDAHLTTCAESTGSVPPEHCGIRIPWGTEFTAVTGIGYRIETLPILQLDDGVFIADGGVLVATITGSGQDGSPLTVTYRTENWSVRGDATITDGRVDLTAW